ncbi:MAG: hypothetical protein FRX49_03807 [Trebouxia sp. A1-2]|nr:MAG: hypothetical protein FRX49_03807 [Trebouxia sp. A1-2]
MQAPASTARSAVPCRQPRPFQAAPRRNAGFFCAPTTRLPRSQCKSNEAQPDPDANLSEALTDWRSFRAHLVALEQTNSALKAELAGKSVDSPVWAHELTLPEKGCLLLAREEGMGQFTNAAVLLCQHDSLGSSGFIINMPLPRHLQDLSTKVALAEELQDKQVYYGGPCDRGTANIIHCCSELEGATQIIEGLYLGGFESVNNLFRLGQGIDPAFIIEMMSGTRF